MLNEVPNNESQEEEVESQDPTEQLVEQAVSEMETLEPEVESQPEEVVQAVETRAKSTGHLSKEEWVKSGRDPKDWKSPEEFVRTGEILDQIYSLKKTVEKRDKEIEALVDYQKRTEERAKERAMIQIESELQAAREYGNIDQIEKLVQERTNIQRQQEIENYSRLYNAQQQAQQEFIERNKHWYNEANPQLMDEAHRLDQHYKQLYPNASYPQLIKLIEDGMKVAHPELGGAVNKPRPVISQSQTAINKQSNPAPSREESGLRGLTPDQQAMFKAIKRTTERTCPGVTYTVEEFKQKLKEDGEI